MVKMLTLSNENSKFKKIKNSKIVGGAPSSLLQNLETSSLQLEVSKIAKK